MFLNISVLCNSFMTFIFLQGSKIMANQKSNPPFKIFVSVPDDHWLSTDQRIFKRKVIETLQADSFEVEIMGEMGMPFTQEKIWSLERAEQIVQCCQGVVVIGLARWHNAEAWANGQADKVQDRSDMITEY